MAVGVIPSGYNTYSYPAKAKAKGGEADFSALVPDAVSQTRDQYSGMGNPRNVSEKSAVSGTQAAKDTQKAAERMDDQAFLHKKIEELFVRFQNGESEPSYQIGAASFTEKEWDKLLEKFDALEEEIRAQMREEHAKRFEEQESDLLSSDYTTATYPPSDPEDDPVYYITCYTEEGIFCKTAGGGYAWEIRFQNKEEYEKVMQFLEQFPSDWNLRFASHKNFWEDFLDDKIDLDSFMEFMEGTDKGVPDYTVTVGDSTYIDRDKAQWAKYMNMPFGQFYTAQEMQQMWEDMIAENSAKLQKLTDPYENIYRLAHPEYRGERIFCEYPGGPLYTANEIGKRMYQNYLDSLQG